MTSSYPISPRLLQAHELAHLLDLCNNPPDLRFLEGPYPQGHQPSSLHYLIDEMVGGVVSCVGKLRRTQREFILG
jgi:hypothetical protein